MYVTEACPSCGAHEFDAWPALVAPFIREYALRNPAPAPFLRECRVCSLRYFDQRYSAEEMQRLYADYRGARYFECRHRHEFRYTARLNEKLGGGESERRAGIETFLLAHSPRLPSGPVLDFGGDRGQFIPELLSPQRFVFDISGKPLLPGVTRIADEAELGKRRYGLVLATHILEHAPEPAALLRTIRGLLDEDGLLYLEVPDERLDLRWIGHGRAYLTWLGILARHRILSIAVELMMGLCGRVSRTIPPLGYVAQHEHINFFNELSIAAILSATGLRALAIAGDGSVFRALANQL